MRRLRQFRGDVAPRCSAGLESAVIVPIALIENAAVATSAKLSLPIIDHKPAPYDGPSRDEVLALRRQYLTPGLVTYYRIRC